MLFKAVSDSVSRVTHSLEGTDTGAGAVFRALSAGATQVNVFAGRPFDGSTSSRTLCSVRTAGAALSSDPAKNLFAPTCAAPAFALGQQSLSTLSFGGQSLIRNADDGALDPYNATPVLRRSDGSSYVSGNATGGVSLDAATSTLTQRYPWGSIVCSYSPSESALELRCTVNNTSADTLEQLKLKLVRLNFPSVVQVRVTEAGMFGNGGAAHPPNDFSIYALPDESAPVLMTTYGGDKGLNFGVESPGWDWGPGVPYSENGSTATLHPFQATLGAPIGPGKSSRFTARLEFFSSSSGGLDTASGLLERYRAAFPQTLVWFDRRPIGLDILADNGSNQPRLLKNPRGWFNNSTQVDVSTPAGLLQFRADLLSRAQGSVGVLASINAQGVNFWDLEGGEYASSIYLGDPRLIPCLAPEMEASSGAGSPKTMPRSKSSGTRASSWALPCPARKSWTRAASR